MKLGKFLREERIKLNLKIEKVAKLCGVSSACLVMIEKGRRFPSISLLIKFSEIFNTPLIFLLNLLADDIKEKDKKIEEEIAKIRLANLFPSLFSQFQPMALNDMLKFLKINYPERFEILYKKAKEKTGENESEEKVIEEYLKREPLIEEKIYKNIYEEYDWGLNELTYPEKLKKIKEVFNFKWKELGVILGKSQRNLYRYLKGEIEIPEKVKERIDEIYGRMFKRIGPILKSQSQNYILKKIEEIGAEDEIKKRIISIYPEMKKYKHLPLRIFFYELSKLESLEEKVEKNMRELKYLVNNKKFSSNQSCVNSFKILPIKNCPVERFKGKRKNRKGKRNEKEEGDEDTDSDFENRYKNYKIISRANLFFENLGLRMGLRGKEVQMAKIYKPKGRKFWYIRIKINGKLRRISTKCEKKKDAEKVLEELLKKQNLQVQTTNHTLYEAIDKFIEEYSKSRKKSWERDIYTARKIKRFFPDMPLNEITPMDIHNWMMARSKTILKNGKRISGRTVNLERAFLHKLFNVAMKTWWWTDRNPVSAVEPLPYQQPSMKVFTPDEIYRICITCEELKIEWFKDFFIFLLQTGFRKGEAIQIRVKDLFFENSKIYVKIIREKSFIHQDYPVFSKVAGKIIIKNYANKNPDDFLFTDGNGRPLNNEILRYWWKRIKEITGIKGRIHDTRHTFATVLRRKGVDPDLVRWLLGQKTLDVTYKYIHLQSKDYEKMLEESGTLLAHFEEENGTFKL